jgi:hypothetical protein
MNEVYSFKVGNPNPRSYQMAFDYALPVFRSLDPEAMTAASSTIYDAGRGVFTVTSFGQDTAGGNYECF